VSIARDEAADSDEYEEEEKPAQKRAKKSAAPVKKPVKKEIEDEQEDEDEIICIDWTQEEIRAYALRLCDFTTLDDGFRSVKAMNIVKSRESSESTSERRSFKHEGNIEKGRAEGDAKASDTKHWEAI
jgi:hypothetical protein